MGHAGLKRVHCSVALEAGATLAVAAAVVLAGAASVSGAGNVSVAGGQLYVAGAAVATAVNVGSAGATTAGRWRGRAMEPLAVDSGKPALAGFGTVGSAVWVQHGRITVNLLQSTMTRVELTGPP